MKELKKIASHKVVKASAWYLGTEFYLKGLNFLTIPIFTRLLSPSDYGITSLYTTWVSIFTILLSLDLNASVTRGKYDFKDDYDVFVSSIMFLSIIIFMAYLVIFTLFDKLFYDITGLNKRLFYFMVFQSYFTFVRTSIIAKLRVEYKYKLISMISIAIESLGVALSIYLISFVFTTEPYIGKILGSGVSIILSGMVFLICLIAPGRKKLLNYKYWRYALILSTPLILHSLSNIMNAQFDRIIINRYIGEKATGLYSFAYNVGMILAVLNSALDRAWSPWVYEIMEEGLFEKLRSKAIIYRNIFTIAFAVLLFFSTEIIKVMANSSYWESSKVVPYIFAGYYFSFMYTLEVKTEIFYKKTWLISMGTLLSAIINIVLNILFIPKFGYIAAAVTTTVSYLFLFIFHYLITSKVIGRKLYGLKFHLTSLTYMLIIIAYYMLFKDMLLMKVVGILTVLVLAYLYEQKYVRKKK